MGVSDRMHQKPTAPPPGDHPVTPPLISANGHSTYGQTALESEIARLATAHEGIRNDTLNEAAFNIGQLVNAGHIEADDAYQLLDSTARRIGLTPAEIAATLRSAAQGAQQKPRRDVPDPNSEPVEIPSVTVLRNSDGEPLPPGQLPDTFWLARPMLDHVRQAAWSRGRSAEAVLGGVLARVAADTNHTIKLPATVGSRCGLSLIVALSGPPGSGKSSSKGIAVELTPTQLIDPLCDDIPPGSGEGILEILFDMVPEKDENGKTTRVKRQTRHNVFAYTDEGELLAIQGRRGTTSTILPTLRSVFTDGTLGQANASEERKRVVPGGRYVYGIVVGIQPEKTGSLFDDAGGGTPQRFLWMTTTSPVPPPGERPEWPGPLTRPKGQPVFVGPGGWKYLSLPEDVVKEIQDNDHDKQQHGCNPLDEHADLLRLKVAGILAALDGRHDINDEDWSLAGTIRQASNATRNSALALLARQQQQQEQTQRERRSRDAVAVDKAVTRRRVVEVAQKIGRKVHKEPERWTFAALRRFLGRDTEVFADAVDHAIEEGWVVEEREMREGTRGPGKARLLRPGRNKP